MSYSEVRLREDQDLRHPKLECVNVNRIMDNYSRYSSQLTATTATHQIYAVEGG